MKIKLILADDHPAVIAGLQYTLSPIYTLDMIGVARNSGEINEILAHSPCDILVTDYSMPGGEFGDGLAMLSFLRRRYPDLKVIVVTVISNAILIGEMKRMGISAVLDKGGDIGHLISAIHAVHSGASYFPASPVATSLSAAAVDQKSSPPSHNLTKRETEVLRLYLNGLSINEIATRLHRTKQTVSAQKINAMRKLGAKSEAELFSFVHEVGLASNARQP